MDSDLLSSIARAGGGRSYFPDELASVPQIFAQETIQASKDALIEQPFPPIPARRSKVLAGIDWSEAPELNGYVLTRIKPTSEQILITTQGRPVARLVAHRAGNVRGVHVGCGIAVGRALDQQLAHGFSQFWAQVARHLMRRQDVEGYEIQVARRGPKVGVTLDAVDLLGEFLNDAETELNDPRPAAGGTLVGRRPECARPLCNRVRHAARGRVLAALDADVAGHAPSSSRPAASPSATPTSFGFCPTDLRAAPPIATSSGGRFRPEPGIGLCPLGNRRVARCRPLAVPGARSRQYCFLFDVVLRRVELGRLHRRVQKEFICK